MNYLDILGYLAGTMVIFSLLPQVIKSWKTKSTKDLSLTRYLMYTAGLTLWLIYGILLPNGPLAVMNAIGLVLGGSILFLKLKHG